MLQKFVILIFLLNCAKSIETHNEELEKSDKNGTEKLKTDLQEVKARKISNFNENLFKLFKKLTSNFWKRSKEKNQEKQAGRKKLSKHLRTHKHAAPLFFKMGAASTWLFLTAFLAAKSVAIGLLLLVLKIVLNSAKLASLLHLLKHKHKSEEHYSWAPPPHHEYHGDYHSLDHHDHDFSPPPIPFHHHDHDRTSFLSLDGPRIDTSAWSTPSHPSSPEWSPDDEDAF